MNEIEKIDDVPIEEPLEEKSVKGLLHYEYDIYVMNAQALGWKVKSFDEWLNS